MRYLALLFVLGCGDPGTHIALVQDASVEFEVRDAAVPVLPVPEEPLAPADPVFAGVSDCPSGWVLQTVGPARICAPFATQPPECAEGDMVVPGQNICTPVGRVCPESGYPEEDGRATLYVAAGPVTPADTGSRATPYHSLSIALAAAVPDSRILLAPGEYVGEFVIDRGISVEGACASSVTLRSTRPRTEFSTNDPTYNGVVDIRGGSLSNVSIVGDARILGELRRRGVVVTRGQAVVDSIRVVDFGVGVAVYGQAEVELTNSLLARHFYAGVSAVEQTRASVRSTEVRDVSEANAFGFLGIADSHLTIADVLTRNAHTAFGINDRAVGTFSRLAIVGGLVQQLAVFDDSMVTLDHAHFERVPSAVTIAERGSLTGHDLVVRDAVWGSVVAVQHVNVDITRTTVVRTDWEPSNRTELLAAMRAISGVDWDEIGSSGPSASVSSHVQLQEVVVVGTDSGFVVAENATLTVDDLFMSDIVRRYPAAVIGINAALEINRAKVLRVREGLLLAGGSVDLFDLQIAECSGTALLAVSLSANVDLAVARATLSALDWGVMALSDPRNTNEAAVSLNDVRVQDAPDGVEGWGSNVTVEGNRLAIERFARNGVLAGAGATVSLANVLATTRHPWQSETGLTFSTAVWNHNASVTLEHSRLLGGWSGLTLTEEDPTSMVAFHDVVIDGSPIGVWIEPAELARLYAPLSELLFAGVLSPVASSDSLPTPEVPMIPDLSGVITPGM